MSTKTLNHASGTIVITPNGELDLNNGSKREQKKKIREYFLQIQIGIANTISEIESDNDTIKKAKIQLKQTEIVRKIDSRRKGVKSKKKKLQELLSQRNGAIGLCEKLGVNIQDELKNIKLLEE